MTKTHVFIIVMVLGLSSLVIKRRIKLEDEYYEILEIAWLSLTLIALALVITMVSLP